MTDKRDAARKGLDDLRKQRLDEFMAGFGIITMRLKEMYQMITLGGDAELVLRHTRTHAPAAPPTNESSWHSL